jgi:hypothetical protein
MSLNIKIKIIDLKILNFKKNSLNNLEIFQLL